MQQTNLECFEDGTRTIDYVLVYREKCIVVEGAVAKLSTFISNLEDQGLEFESEFMTKADDRVIFVKIHGPNKVMRQYAEVHNIELECENYNHMPDKKGTFQCMDNELSKPNSRSPVFQRAPESVSGERPSAITSSERILIIRELLSSTHYGTNPKEYGLKRLITQGIVEVAYPYHDGSCEWTTNGPLNDRQLLAKYWGNIGSYWKEQPLNLINKYYGSEVAFCFAWMGLYTNMLLPVGVLGVLSFCYGLLRIYRGTIISKEVCNSNILLCPPCENYYLCHHLELKDSCLLMTLIYLFDNQTTIFLAIITSCWAAVFMQLWARKENLLKFKWNLLSLEVDTSMRYEFKSSTPQTKKSSITEILEPYVPLHIKFASFFGTYLISIIMAIISLTPTIGITVYRLSVKILIYNIGHSLLRRAASLFVSVTGSLFVVIFIQFFSLFYNKIALWLTELENPRTQAEFDDSYVYKMFALAFVNNYVPFIYLAFLKGQLYTYPNDKGRRTRFEGIESDLCDPAGCLVDLGIQLFILMCIRSSIRKLVTKKLSSAGKMMKGRWVRNTEATVTQPEWEKQYQLNRTDRYFLVHQSMEMVIQYGFIAFFAASFPLAFPLAYFNNLLELRINAHHLVWQLQRPIPKKIAGIGAWNRILRAITSLSITAQALVIAFTSSFVQREVYRVTVDSQLRGFVNSTLSVFSMTDYYIQERVLKAMLKDAPNATVCYYPGYRYPPNHPRRYQLTDEYYYLLLMKLIVVFVFEHCMSMLKSFLTSVIPTIPYFVKARISYQQEQLKGSRIKILNDAYDLKHGKLSIDKKKKLKLPLPGTH